MNRLLKFRAWDEETKTMVTPYSIHFSSSGQVAYCIDPYMREIRNPILMQLTGLQDKNGVDLDWWEGDLLKDGYKVMKVVYDEGCFWGEWVKHPENRVALRQLAIWSKHITKIGSAHTHPELLK
jgi:hypothetical protein